MKWIIIAVCASGGLVAVWLFYQFNQSSQLDRSQDSVLESYGVIDAVSADLPVVHGSLLFTTSEQSGVAYQPYLSIAPVTDIQNRSRVIPDSFQNYSKIATDMYLGLQNTQTDQGGLPDWRLVLVNQTSSEQATLSVKDNLLIADAIMMPTQEYYAYSFLPRIPAVGTNPLETWSIAVHAQDGSEVAVIPQSHEPVWIPNTTSFLYITKDGIGMYDTETGASRLVLSQYTNLSLVDDLAISPDGSWFILTVPNQHLISVLEWQTVMGDGKNLIETSRVVTPDVYYRHPVIDPTGTYVAIVATDKEKPETARVEIRVPKYDGVITTQNLGVQDNMFTLIDWQY
jgi:hypothetical protein